MKQFLAWAQYWCSIVMLYNNSLTTSILLVICNLPDKADLMIIGKGMVNTFLNKLKGMERRNLLYNKNNGAKIVQELADKAESKGVNFNIYFPKNFVTADKFDKDHEMPWYISTIRLSMFNLGSGIEGMGTPAIHCVIDL